MRKLRFIFAVIPTLALAQIGPVNTNLQVSPYMKGVLKSANQNQAHIALGISGTTGITAITVGNLPPLFNSSVGTSGTTRNVTFALSDTSANLVWAGPTSGGAAAPSYRALIANDIPGTLNATTFNGAVNIAQGFNLNSNNISVLRLSDGSSTLINPITNSGSVYLNWDRGAGTIFGNGASGQIGAVDAVGNATFNGRVFVNNAVANLFLKDLLSGWQVAATQVITPQTGNSVRNTTFTSGLRGWNINDLGDVEFNNATIRGELRTFVFKVNEIAATAGTFGVFYSATTLTDNCTTPGVIGSSFTFNAKNSDVTGSAMMLGIGDIIRMKAFVNSGGVIIADVWATVTARTNNATYTTYTATLNSGSVNATIPAGVAVVDYGPIGSGFITQSADGTVGASPNMTMATHSGTPWSGFTTLMRQGNLDGSYGYATTTYGIGIGQYGAGSCLTFDLTNGIRIIQNTTVIGQWDMSGNARFGVPSAGNIFISSAGQLDINFNGVTYGSWSSGGATFGQVATNKANVFWNNSNQRLEFRGGTGGTVVQAYIGTDGSFNAAGGIVNLSAAGLKLDSTTVGASSSYTVAPSAVDVGWYTGGTQTGVVVNNYFATDATSVTNVIAYASSATGHAVSFLKARTDADNSNQAWLAVHSYGASVGDKEYANLWGNKLVGLMLGSTFEPTEMLEVTGRGKFTMGIRIGQSSAPANEANTAVFYAQDVAGTAEMFVKDEAGTATQISPHAPGSPAGSDLDKDSSQAVPIVLHHANEYLGVEEWLHLSAMAREVEKLTGKRFIYSKPLATKLDWNAEQEARAAKRATEIAYWKKQKAAADKAMAAWNKLKPADRDPAKQPLAFSVPQPSPYVKKQPPKVLKDRLK